MAEQLEVKELDQVVVRFSGDSGDGMQLVNQEARIGPSLVIPCPCFPLTVKVSQ